MGKWIFFVLIFGLCACAQKPTSTGFRGIASLQNPADVEGIWDLQGSNASRGPYTGQMELRRSHDGTFSVIRVINYIRYYYQGLRVQEVWTGKAVPSQQNLVVTYDLKAADFVTSYESTKRSPEDFKKTVSINEFFNPTEKNTLESKFSDSTGSAYQEWIMSKKSLGDKPLWSDERANLSAKSPRALPASVKNQIRSAKAKIGFDKDAFVKSYAHRVEFKNEQPFIVFDPTDYDFYQKDNEVLRVTNKSIDGISLVEALIRRNAYAPSLEQKQRGFDRNAQEKHVNEYGLISSADLDEKGALKSYVVEGDSTLWTGLYVGSQAMRYLKTRDSEALENVKKSLQGISILSQISGDPHVLAKALEKNKPETDVQSPWHRGEGAFTPMNWLEGGDRQTLIGIVHALAWGSLVVPADDSSTWGLMRQISQSLLGLNLINESVQNKVLVDGVAAYLRQDDHLKSEYRNLYKENQKKLSNAGFYWAGSADWKNADLQVLADTTEILLADLLKETDIRDQLRERLMNEWVTYSPAQRHLITLTSYAFAYRYGTRGGHFQAESSEAKFQKSLQMAVWGLKQTPYPRTAYDLSYDHSLSPSWCLSPIPDSFWEGQKKDDNFYQGLYGYPAFEASGIDSDFMWKESTFKYKGSLSKNREFSGADYLYAYWLARYAGVIDEKN